MPESSQHRSIEPVLSPCCMGAEAREANRRPWHQALRFPRLPGACLESSSPRVAALKNTPALRSIVAVRSARIRTVSCPQHPVFAAHTTLVYRKVHPRKATPRSGSRGPPMFLWSREKCLDASDWYRTEATPARSCCAAWAQESAAGESIRQGSDPGRQPVPRLPDMVGVQSSRQGQGRRDKGGVASNACEPQPWFFRLHLPLPHSSFPLLTAPMLGRGLEFFFFGCSHFQICPVYRISCVAGSSDAGSRESALSGLHCPDPPHPWLQSPSQAGTNKHVRLGVAPSSAP
jgi:hypothetical protein